MHVILASNRGDQVRITLVDSDGTGRQSELVNRAELPARVAVIERQHPRWVWDDTSRWYPGLLAAGVRVDRCVDLRLCHAILRNSTQTAGSSFAQADSSGWDCAASDAATPDGLFELEQSVELDPIEEFDRQQQVITPRLALLLAAESAGSLVAAEIEHAGLPWRADVHEELLTATLGPRPAFGQRPAAMQTALLAIQAALNDPELNPDSATELLKSLHRAGLMVSSTRSWELKKVEHPAIQPILEYKKLARLLSANGWHWLEANVRDGRFRPQYVPGGVVTGRWASKGGGGALQLPKQVRGAVVADPGWKLVVADASQLEPRILAAMAEDHRMIEAGMVGADSAGDLYAGIVASGAVATRAQAKVAMLGAMYGATSGESGRLMPALARAYPRAIALVEAAARSGERGEKVSTRLARSSPLPGEPWHEARAAAANDGASDAERSRASSAARSWGRFTRNFVVQGTAAEWALCWMATLRRELNALGDVSWYTRGPHLVFFMHDEVVVHCPAELADAVANVVRAAAVEAGRLLFGQLPVDFPLTVAIVGNYGEAK